MHMAVDAELRATQVDLGGLMKVLGHNLYSSPQVAVRELVQNAHDSCTRRRLAGDADFEPLITVTPDPQAHTLVITDTGAGLTHDELVRDLATVGAGATGRLREATQTRELIGAFGLGFLSAYFVSDRVEVRTTSHREPDAGWLFSSRGGERYRLQPLPARPVGSEVTVHLAAEFHHLADADVLIAFLTQHCGLLPLPIIAAGQRINLPPPWRQPELHPVRWKREALAFAERFDRRFTPLCVVPVQGAVVRGLAWVQDGGTYGTTDNRHVSAFVRGMLVDGDARELLPVWAGFCGAVLESDELTPTASREALQTDALYRQAQAEVREALIAGLQQVAHEDEAAWRRVLLRHNEALLGASLCDDRLFTLLSPRLKVPTSQGDLSLEALRRRTRGRIPVKTGDAGDHEAMLFKAQHIPVVDGTRYAVLPFCEREAQRVGAELIAPAPARARRPSSAPPGSRRIRPPWRACWRAPASTWCRPGSPPSPCRWCWCRITRLP
ncbi:MAG: ATP-binding protein [bacterium]